MDPAHGSRSVLLVERDTPLCATHHAWLESAGYRVTTVNSYEAAKRALSAAAPDVLIAGVRLGAFNGLHLIIRARIDSPLMAGVLLATADDRSLEREAHGAGARFLVEPVSADALLAAVAQALGGLPA